MSLRKAFVAAASYTVLLPAFVMNGALANDGTYPQRVHPYDAMRAAQHHTGRPPERFSAAPGVRPAVGHYQGAMPGGVQPTSGMHMQAQQLSSQSGQPGFVHLGAPLYSSPNPNVPIWTGSTMITNQAFAPHEFLYPHTYRSLHGPYYHRVVGGWVWTPFGIRSHERWDLQGTMVQVKYRSSYPLWPSWKPPLPMNTFQKYSQGY